MIFLLMSSLTTAWVRMRFALAKRASCRPQRHKKKPTSPSIHVAHQHESATSAHLLAYCSVLYVSS